MNTMKLNRVLVRYQFPEEARRIYLEAGINDLFPPQEEAIRKGILDGKNLLMAVPTAAGKTLIAEIAMLNAFLESNGRCLYIVPLKALAVEKYEDFQKKFAGLGIKVGLATGDTDISNKTLSEYQILVATSEKVDALLRARAQWLVTGLRTVVLDEVHFINDGSRGPTLEIIAARIRQLNNKVQILALSATVGNAEEIAKWLNAETVISDWRPIPLHEGVYFNEKITFDKSPDRLVKEDEADPLSKLVSDTLSGKGQVLVFVNSRRSAQAASRQISRCAARVLTDEEKKILAQLSADMLGQTSESTKICRALAEVVKHGAAFHHAGLRPKQRKMIEDAFKKNLIKVICSTPTLAAGVNLPARRAVIRDVKRFESRLGSAFIPISEYKQCAGRAGRPQYDTYGEAVLIAKSAAESKALFNRYIHAAPEPVISKLGDKAALRIHILASIAGGYVHDVNDTFEFISHTFLAHQKRAKNLIELISDIFDFLLEEEFIEKRGFQFYATPFGQYTSRLYIDPVSSIILRNGLEMIHDGKSFSNIGLLHMLCCCPDSPILHFGKSDAEEIQNFAANCQDEFIMTKETLPMLEDYMLNLSIIKTTLLLAGWIEESREEELCDGFNIGPGDIYRHVETVRWLLQASLIFAELFEFKKLTGLLGNLESRVRYGIKEELLALCRLKGVGRVRGRQLYVKGFKTPADLKAASVEELAKVPKIGRSLAKELHDQVNENSYLRQVRSIAQEAMQSFQ